MVDGHDGHRAIQLQNTSAGAMTLALNDRLNTVATTTAGATYTAGAWVRTDAPGLTAGSRMMEYEGSTLHGSKQGSAWLRTTDWAYVSTTYTAVTNTSSIDFNVLAWQLPVGKSLLISDPSLVQTGGPVSSSSSATSSAAPSSTAPTSVTPTSPVQTPSSPVTSAHQPPPSSSSSVPTPVSSSPSPTPTPVSGGYHLVWSDEFNNLDTAKWNVRNNTWSNNEQSIDTSRPQNVFVSNGALTLRAIQQSYTAYGTTRGYTSGYLDTIGKESWQYGRIEMRAKLPVAQGLWPAFWLRNDVGLGELDIMEAIGGMNRDSVQTVHQSTNGDMATARPRRHPAERQQRRLARLRGGPGARLHEWYVDDRLVFTKSCRAARPGWTRPSTRR